MKKKIAVIGSAFRFPGTDTHSYWSDLLGGKDLVSTVSTDRWSRDSYLHPGKAHPGTSYTFSAGSLGDVSGFDAGFFGISPREAAQMDPQQRLLLEMVWEAVEDAGVKPTDLRGTRCGVFIGIASADYSYRYAEDLGAMDSAVATGNTASIAANRISYVFDLRGPSLAIDTACSSSLVAFHQACRSIASGETSMAVTGGISLHLHPYGFIIFSKASMLSPTGICNVFDESGDGYVRSEGGGIFLLKDYDLALADGDRILAVVEATAVNTDGRKSGLTVPSGQAQMDLLREAYELAGIDPAEIDYIEAHGTGTVVGDPIETQALGEALGQRRPKDQPLLIGSVKSNLGHLEPASGVAGLVKAIHCLRHREVPATIHLKNPNPKIRFDEWNIRVARENTPLKSHGRLVVGVNSFGFGGANAHVVLSSPDEGASGVATTLVEQDVPLLLTGKSTAALRAVAVQLADVLERGGDLYALAYHQAFRRDWHEQRALVFGNDGSGMAEALRRFGNGGDLSAAAAAATATATASMEGSEAVFVYSGNGSQWEGMGARLLADPVFAVAVGKVDALFIPLAGFSLADELSGKNGEMRYERTEIAQPALFALQVGVTEMLRSRGLMPAAVVGHSVGEVAAAWASGALTLEQAVQVIFHRSAQQGKTKGLGKMLAVSLGEAECRKVLEELDLAGALVLAGVNSARGVTVAGGVDSLDRFEAVLSERQVACKRLDLDYAFHSPAMDGVESQIRLLLKSIAPQTGQTSFFSSVTGGALDGLALDADYWWRNIREPVLFHQAIRELLDTGHRLFVEIGPHAVLRGYVNEALRAAQATGRVLPTLVRQDDAPARVWKAAAECICLGGRVDWSVCFPQPAPHVELPAYPWQRERHWHDVTPESLGLLQRHKVHPLLGYRLAQQEWVWENQLDTRLNPSLADHVVGEATVFPGTGFAELALACAQQWQTLDTVDISDLEIRQPLLFGDDSKLLRCRIEPADGSLVISGRTYGGEEALTVHAVGRVAGAVLAECLAVACPPEPERVADFDAAEHRRLTLLAGLDYGPAYRAVDVGWVEKNRVLARLVVPEAIAGEVGNHHLHPSLLDNTFQLIIHLLKDELLTQEGVAYVPTRIGRLICRAGHLVPQRVCAELRRRSPHSLSVDFSLFDADGVCVARVQEARFRSVRLRRQQADHLRWLDFRKLPQPHPLAPMPALDFFTGMVHVAGQCLQAPEVVGEAQRYAEEIEPLLDALSHLFVRKTLADLEPAAAERLAPFFAGILEVGAESVAEGADELLPADVWNALLADYPDCFHVLQAVGRQGLHCAQLSDAKGGGKAFALWPELARQILGASFKRALVAAMRGAIAQAVAQLPPGQRLRIVELASSAPLLAVDLCQTLDFDRCDYFLLTQVANLADCQEVQERFPRIELLDQAAIEVRGAFAHLAIAVGDYGTESGSGETLRLARQALLASGCLSMPGVQPSAWADFVFAGDAAWWHVGAGGLRVSGHQGAQAWMRRMQSFGFESSVCLQPLEGQISGTYLLLAQAPVSEVSMPVLPCAGSRWLLLGETKPSPLENALAQHLLAHGCKIWRNDSASSRETFEAELLALGAEAGGVDHIVLLRGLNDGQALSAEAQFARQVDRCALAVALLQACEATQSKARLWLLTSCEAALGDELQSALDAPLWGLGRTMMNEAANNDVRLLALPPQVDVPGLPLLNAVLLELLGNDAEQEVFFGAAGERLVPRLGAFPRHAPVQQEGDGKGEEACLGFQFPGQLRNLRWMSVAQKTPVDDEVEIAVYATGLNFRDVMYALGLLSDEAVENGFAGPSLGLECAGVVTAVGAAVSGLSVGDRVVAFGPSCFSKRVVTRADAVALIPGDISFEAAATIPSTFFTAYYALHHMARLEEGEKVLIHGAAGGVGIAAIQIAKWRGAEIFATAGSDDKRDFLRLLGVDHIHDSRSLDFADEILAVTGGKGVDVVLNSLAGEAINRNFQVLRPFGRFLELGKRDFYENTKIGLRPFRNNISYFGIDADQLMAEQPRLTRRLFAEVMQLFADGILHPLPYTAFEADHVVDAFRHMQQAKQIGKIVVTYESGIRHLHRTPAKREALQLAASGTYLVTGGLRGFGLRTAQWLAERGARHLVLISRSGPVEPEAQAAVAELQEAGVKVLAVACDVTDAEALADLFAQMQATMPPLRGIVHAAMVIDDGLIRSLDRTRIERVLAPKIRGAMNLHAISRGLPLDFFVLFSSATTVFGNPGQGSYVAANAWLEAFAEARRAAGLPALCVRWGAIGDAGFLARNSEIKEALQGRMGGGAIPAATALAELEALILADRSSMAVLEVDWRALNRFLPTASSPKFSELARLNKDGDEGEDRSEDIQALLAELSDADLAACFVQMLKEEVGEILRIDPEKIDAQRSIYDMGLDSLMGVELVTAVENRFGVRLQVMALSESPSIAKLADKLIGQLKGGDSSAKESGEPDLSGQIAQMVSQHGVEVDTEEVDQYADEIRQGEVNQSARMIH